MTVLTEAIF